MNLVTVLEDLKIEHLTEGHEHCREGWVQIDCPHCSPNWKHYRLGINLEYGYANCWACGPKYLVEVIGNIANISWSEVKELLGQVEFHSLPKEKTTGRYRPPPMVAPMMPMHRNYLKKRGFNPNIISRLWDVYGIGPHGYFKWRIFIPIYYRGQRVSWTTRSISDRSEMRYISAPPQDEAVPHKHILYGMDYVRHAAVLHEGPLDVWATGPGAVCSFGLSYTMEQLALLASIPFRVVCFDNDNQAQKRARDLCKRLAPYPGRTINVTLAGKDAASSRKEAKKLRRLFLTKKHDGI